MKNSRELLADCGLNCTKERMLVIEYLQRHRTHPTAEEIYEGLCKMNAGVSRATVFNTLKTLSVQNALLTLQIGDGATRYDIYTTRHAHFRCLNCGKIEDIPMRKEDVMQLPQGYEICQSDYHFTGYCPECSGKSHILR